MLVDCPSCGVKNRVPAARLDDSARCGKCKTSLVPLGKATSLESAADFIELIKSSPLPVLVDFWAPWCGPCRVVGPELERVASDKQGQVIVAKVNTDELRDVAGRYDIRHSGHPHDDPVRGRPRVEAPPGRDARAGHRARAGALKSEVSRRRSASTAGD